MPRQLGTNGAPSLASAPAVGVAGALYFNSTDGLLYRSNGTVWAAVPLDSLVVHLAGTETITGAKTMTNKLTMTNDGGAAEMHRRNWYYSGADNYTDLYFRYRGTSGAPSGVTVGDTIYSVAYQAQVGGSVTGVHLDKVTTDNGDPGGENNGKRQWYMRNNGFGSNEVLTMGPYGDLQLPGHTGAVYSGPDAARAKFVVVGGDTMWTDATVTASIAGTVMTVTAVTSGAIRVGNRVMAETSGVIAPGTYIASFGTGTGGIGTYNLTTAHTVASRTIKTLRSGYGTAMRFRNNYDSVVAGRQIGTIEFWSDTATGSGVGTKSFVASEMTGTGGAALLFGTAGTAAGANAIERMRINATGDLTVSTSGAPEYTKIWASSGFDRKSSGSILDITDHFSTSGITVRWYSNNSNTVNTRAAFSGTSLIFKDDYYGVTSSGSSSQSASIQIRADGAATSSIAPGQVWITTTGDDSSGWYRFRLNKNGLLSLGQDVDARAPIAAYPARLELQGRGDWATLLTSSISATTLTVGSTTGGQIYVGSQIWGPGVTPGTYVTAFGTGTGAAGTYTVSVSQTVGSTTLYCDGSYNENNVLRFRNANTTTAAARQPLGGLEWYTADSTGPGIKAYIKAMSNSAAGDDAAISIGTASSGGQLTERLFIDNAGIVVTVPVVTAASTTAAASLRVPHGAAPTTPINGDMWTTTAGLYAQINGTTVGPFGTGGGGGATWGSITGTLSSQTDLNSALGLKANDADVVHIINNETIEGLKTFEQEIRVIAPANTYSAVLDDFSNLVLTASVNEAGWLQFKSHGGTTNAAQTASTSGFSMGEIQFHGHDGTQFLSSAKIVAEGAGTISTGIVPGLIRFSTVNDTGSMGSRLTIGPDGTVTFTPTGTTNNAHAYIAADGSITQKSTLSGNLEVTRYSTSGGPSIQLRRSTSATIGATGTAESGTGLGTISFYGHNTSTYGVGASILAFSDATWTTSSQPGYLALSTTPSGSTTVVERMRLRSTGRVQFTPAGATTSPYAIVDTDGTFRSFSTGSGGIEAWRYSSTAEPSLNMYRSVSDTIGTNATATADAVLGTVRYGGYDSAVFATGGALSMAAEALWTTTSRPTRFSINLTPSGSTTQFERFRIDSTGAITGVRATGGSTVIQSPHFYGLTSARTLTNGTGAQSIFGVGLTVAASTTYEIEMEVAISCSGTTTAIKQISFGGTATLTSIGYQINYTHSATSVATTGASNNLWIATAASTNLGATGTTNNSRYKVKGLVRVNATGTFIPQIAWSAAPGAAPSVVINSYVKMTPIGSNTVTTIGTWA